MGRGPSVARLFEGSADGGGMGMLPLRTPPPHRISRRGGAGVWGRHLVVHVQMSYGNS